MTTGADATAVPAPVEEAFFASAGDHELFGVITMPTAEPRGVGVLVLAGGRYEQTAGRNRVARRLAHALAGDGFHVARFDYHGCGDSTGVNGEFVLHEPFTADLEAAASQLRAAGASRLVLIGDCFGARTALAGAVGRDDVAALLLVSLPWRDLARSNRKAHIQSSQLSLGDYAKRGASSRVLRRLGDPAARKAYARLVTVKVRHLARSLSDRVRGVDIEPWVSRHVVRQLAHLRRHRIPTLLLYGRGPAEDYTADFDQLRTASTLAWLGGPGEPVEVRILATPVAGYRNLVAQEQVVAVAQQWLGSVVGRSQEVR